ncbi:hypothetical protein TIFTF001_016731 [Ficus carica]|uniref:Uncharacterized protein n=1 Tax=Ficus carica TaxID=3494 RepID=A0AA88D6F1_FICCA|nr:hypothetical protein TIFTF001_016731 [Ficus carica]
MRPAPTQPPARPASASPAPARALRQPSAREHSARAPHQRAPSHACVLIARAPCHRVPSQRVRSEKSDRWSPRVFRIRPVRPVRKNNKQNDWALCSRVLGERSLVARVLGGGRARGRWAPAGGLVRTSEQKILAGFSNRPNRGTGQAGPEKQRAKLLAGLDRVFRTGLTGSCQAGPEKQRASRSELDQVF